LKFNSNILHNYFVDKYLFQFHNPTLYHNPTLFQFLPQPQLRSQPAQQLLLEVVASLLAVVELILERLDMMQAQLVVAMDIVV
jgi:hypothetical protein